MLCTCCSQRALALTPHAASAVRRCTTLLHAATRPSCARCSKLVLARTPPTATATRCYNKPPTATATRCYNKLGNAATRRRCGRFSMLGAMPCVWPLRWCGHRGGLARGGAGAGGARAGRAGVVKSHHVYTLVRTSGGRLIDRGQMLWACWLTCAHAHSLRRSLAHFRIRARSCNLARLHPTCPRFLARSLHHHASLTGSPSPFRCPSRR